MLRAMLDRLGVRSGALPAEASGAQQKEVSGGLPAQPWSLPAPTTASTADILACFRLLLGRNPNREEWAGHAMRAGEELGGVVASYLNSLEFSRRGLLTPDPAAGAAVLAQLEGFRIFIRPEDPLISLPVSTGRYEPDVTAVLRRLLRPGMAVLDLGANIGYFTMLSAHLVGSDGHVLAVEPNPQNTRLIEASRRANGFGQVTVCQAAAGRAIGVLSLHTSYSNGTTSPVSDDLAPLTGAATVGCFPVDTLVSPARRVGLIKVDVEGAEYNALLGAEQLLRRDRPTIVSEFSPGLMPGISSISGVEYLRWLSGLGYGLSVIRPDGTWSREPQREAMIMQEYEDRSTDHVDLIAIPSDLPG